MTKPATADSRPNIVVLQERRLDRTVLRVDFRREVTRDFH
jgi:hypothetical protein